MPRVIAKKKDYKVIDLKGWIVKQMKLHNMNQTDVADALGVSQSRVSVMLKIPKAGERVNSDPFSYGDLLTLCELFDASDDEKKQLLTM